MLDMDPCIFQFEIAVDGAARAGFGVIAAYVPAAEGWGSSDPVSISYAS